MADPSLTFVNPGGDTLVGDHPEVNASLQPELLHQFNHL